MFKKILSAALSISLLVSVFAFAAPLDAQAATANISGTITLSGSTSVAPLAQELAKAFKKEYPNIKVDFTNITGSGSGIADAKNGVVDIGMSSRPLTADEKNTLKETIICNDGVAVVVNLSNPLTNITPQQLYDIYAKTTDDWTSISGSYTQSTKVAAYSREEGSGTRSCFEDVLKNDFALAISSKYGKMDGVIPNTGAMQTSVKGNKGAIGYMSLGDMDSKQVKALKFNGVAASVYNVANGSYKMSRPFVYATKGTPNAATQTFMNWSKGSTAQSIVSKMGFVKLGLMKPVVAKSFTLNKTKVVLAKKGKKATLSAKSFTPSDTANKKLTFKSSKPKVATVSKTGVVTAKSAGKTTITVTTTDGSKISKKCTVTVKK